MSRALSQGVSAVEALLKQDPALANEISTGSAHPLHTCGMSARNLQVPLITVMLEMGSAGCL